jgi:NAD(P)-dependent dehydrogenase (short-subunit alcohol dehydrogenase family)
VVDGCARHFGRLDFLVNNAAVYYKTTFGSVTEEAWDSLLSVNLKAPFFCAQFAAKIMKRNGFGRIVNIADVAAMAPWPDFIPYCASKAGLVSVTQGLAQALAPEIQVNAVAPGTVLMADSASEEYTEQIRRNTLLQRIGTPEDIANAVLFLLKHGDYMTGSVISVDGGRLLSV